MNLDNALDGHAVAAVLEILLVDAGYQVIPFGVERTVRELRAVDQQKYLNLIHPSLRTVPDFFILDFDEDDSWLTEVKYRRALHTGFVKDLEAIQKKWAPFTLILAIREPPDEWKGVIRHIRVFEIGSDTDLDFNFLRDEGQRIQDVFSRLGKRWQDASIERAQEFILRITAER